jgi:hypothetical protein
MSSVGRLIDRWGNQTVKALGKPFLQIVPSSLVGGPRFVPRDTSICAIWPGADVPSPNLPRHGHGILLPSHRRWTACLAVGDVRALGGAESSKLSFQRAIRGRRLTLATGPSCWTSGGRLHPAATLTREGEIRLNAIDFFVRLVPNDHEVTQSLDSRSRANAHNTTPSTSRKRTALGGHAW